MNPAKWEIKEQKKSGSRRSLLDFSHDPRISNLPFNDCDHHRNPPSSAHLSISHFAPILPITFEIGNSEHQSSLFTNLHFWVLLTCVTEISFHPSKIILSKIVLIFYKYFKNILNLVYVSKLLLLKLRI